MSPIPAYSSATIRRKLSTAARLVRTHPGEILRTLIGRPESYVTYVASPSDVPAPRPIVGWEFQHVEDEVVLALAQSVPELGYQAERLAEGHENDAYALYIDGVVAGVAWMVPMEHDVNYQVRNVKLEQGEVEITHCFTLSAFRRLGVYAFMIGALCSVARERNVKRVFMITNRANHASQHGIVKAGLKQTGGIYKRTFDYLGPTTAVTFRRHRWGRFGWR